MSFKQSQIIPRTRDCCSSFLKGCCRKNATAGFIDSFKHCPYIVARAQHISEQYIFRSFHCWIPWVPEGFLFCFVATVSGEVIFRSLVHDRGFAAHCRHKTTTTKKPSGTKGNCWRARHAYVLCWICYCDFLFLIWNVLH